METFVKCVILALLGVAVAGVIYLRQPAEKQSIGNRQAESEVRLDRARSAAVTCEQFVTKGLEDPSTARFQDIYAAHVADLGDGRYIIKSHVDSQNSVGAMLRMNYECDVTNVGDKWRLASLKTLK